MNDNSRVIRPEGWWEAIDAALAAAPQPSAPRCHRLAALLIPATTTPRPRTMLTR